jgi:exopolyphosphatase/guanosine-5'-triphosphate,3'-diphosphate pyrophosphatase
LLEAAAVLHDIGMVVGYAKHHKHSRDIILGADLQHVSRRDKLVLANIVRYHRRVGPRKTHSAFVALSPKDQHLVRVLAGVLRVADGLDRSHESLVTGAGVAFKKTTVTITAAPRNPADRLSRELRAARSKSDLLASVLDRKIQFVAAANPPRDG